MPELLSILLIVVFSIHLIVFLTLYVRNKKKLHLIFTLVFVMLVLSHALRLWGTDISLFGYAAHECLRWAAWFTTAVAVVFMITKKFKH